MQNEANQAGQAGDQKTKTTSPIMQYFRYEHLPPKLQAHSRDVCDIARKMDATLPHGPEKSAGLRKLLEAKDCFVRAAI